MNDQRLRRDDWSTARILCVGKPLAAAITKDCSARERASEDYRNFTTNAAS
jgi:hypothetical protein